MMFRRGVSIQTRPAAGVLPAWFTGAASGQWVALPGNTLSASGVLQTGDETLFTAWGGGVYNTVGVYDGSTFVPGIFLVIWGGGHGDSSSNAVYARGPLDSDTPIWRRLRDRTSTPPQNVSEDGSGNPVSRHTFQSIAYDPINNWMFSSGGLARYSDANGIIETHTYQFNTANPNSAQPWTKKTNAPGASDVSSYDSTTGLIWSHQDAQGEVQTYQTATDTWDSQIFKSPGWSGANACSAIDTTLGLWAIKWNAGINFFRTTSLGNDYYSPSETGTGPTGTTAILYDPTAGAFKCWNGGGKQLFTFTPPGTSPYQGGNAWTWSSNTPAGGDTPDAAQANGTYGRFGYVDNGAGLRGYFLCNSATSAVYFYKP